jgi:Ca2+-binding EF-hand superfamily protein
MKRKMRKEAKLEKRKERLASQRASMMSLREEIQEEDPVEPLPEPRPEEPAELSIAAALSDPGVDLEVARLVKDTRMKAVHQALAVSSKVDDSGEEVALMSRNKLSRALEAAGHRNPDPNLIAEALACIEGEGPLDLHCFAVVVVAFNKKRTSLLRQTFRQLDDDNSGTVSMREFRHLLWDLGFTVSMDTVKEFFSESDSDNSGQIDFREFEAAFELVHLRHGFSRAEVKEVEDLFDRYDTDGSGEIAADELASALGWHGSPTTIGQARAIIAKFDDDGNGNLCKFEFLQVMRARLEHEIEEMRTLFAEYDVDMGGTLDSNECLSLLQCLGYTMSPEVLTECIQECHMSNRELVFEDVLKLMHMVRKREGFSRREAEELTEIFNRNDSKGSGNMREFELARALTWLGYPVSPHKRRQLWVLVDLDKTNSIEVGEFLKLVRLLREEEMLAAKKMLEKHRDAKKLREKDLKDMLITLSYAPAANVLQEATEKSLDTDGNGKPDLQGVIAIINFIRESQVAKLRQSAGLPDKQAQKIRGKFGHRAEQGKHIVPGEFERFMYDLFPVARRDKQERERIRKLIHEHSKDDGSIDFQEAFWIVRIFTDMRDEEAWRHEQEVANQAGFGAVQVSQFREAFVAADDDESGYLDANEVFAVLDELMALNRIQVEIVKKELSNLGDKKECLDFADFLRLLHLTLSAAPKPAATGGPK